METNLENSCDVCRKPFGSQYLLRRHQIEQHGSTDAFITCEACNQTVTRQAYPGHIRSIHHKNNVRHSVTDGVEMVATTFKSRLATFRLEPSNVTINVDHLFHDLQPKIIELISKMLVVHITVKLHFELFGVYVLENKGEKDIKSFMTKNVVITRSSDLDGLFVNIIAELNTKMDAFQERDSGWALQSLLYLEVSFVKFNPFKAGVHIKLPQSIINKKAVINIKNEDEYCFAYSIMAALFPPTGNASLPTSYPNFRDYLNFDNISFPVKLCDVSKFEIQNNISINVYGLEETYENEVRKHDVVGPLHFTNRKQNTHINLLLIDDGNGNHHYCLIKNLSRLVRSQVTKYEHQLYLCDGCLQYFRDQEKLNFHNLHDCEHVYVKIPSTTPKLDKFGREVPENILKFENIEKKIKVPFVVYADFESLLIPIQTMEPNTESSFTCNKFKHVPYAFAYNIKCSYDESKSKFVSYRGDNVAHEFVKRLDEDVLYYYHNYLKVVIPIKPLSESEELKFKLDPCCHICEKPFATDEIRVKDHSHLTGQFVGPAHVTCNLNYQLPKFIPVVFHNLRNYDLHLFVKTLAMNGESLQVIPLNTEKYISLSKQLLVDSYVNEDGKRKNVYVNIRFIDSFQFLPAALEKLAGNLSPTQCTNVKRRFGERREFELIRQKGVFPYCYVDSFDKLNETSLPAKSEFYDVCNEEGISDQNYERACEVWRIFNCKSLGEYADLYLTSDVLLLTDVFENFRTLCLEVYKLDPAMYFTSPGLAWDAALKITGVELELLTDIEMLHFLKKSVRGGVSVCVSKKATANNKFIPTYDPNQRTSYLMYLDATNLYGWGMEQPLPTGRFRWLSEEERNNLNIFNIADTSDIGYILEVDLEYPSELHDLHKDFPFCPENIVPPNGKHQKLIPNLYNKTKYVLHYRNLKQCVENDLVLRRIHRVLEFHQTPFLKPYIELNTRLRSLAKNDFEKSFYKLMNNSVFGKTMENVDKRVDIKLVSEWESRGKKNCAQKLVARPNFKRFTIFSESLVAVELGKVKVVYNKPIYLGFTILDLSKIVMYDFFYSHLKQLYGNDVSLLYTDTDSFILQIFTDNAYEDIKTNIDKYDTSNYKPDNLHGMPKTESLLGKFKDEYAGEIITNYIGVASKSYCVQTLSQTVKKAKGVKSSVIKKNLDVTDYLRVVDNNDIVYRKMYIFKSHLHDIYTQLKNKVALAPRDDKRFAIPDSHSTLPWGHEDILVYQRPAEENNTNIRQMITELSGQENL